MLKLSAAAVMIASLSSVVLAQEPQRPGERPPSADGTVPMTDKADGPAKTALPEQDASPQGKTERPGSAASENAERIK